MSLERCAARCALALVILFPLYTRAADEPEQVLLAADRDFQKATWERGLEGWMSYMAPEAVLDAGSGKPLVGHDAIRADRKMLDDPNVKLLWAPLHGELFASGDTGYTTGKWKIVRRDAPDTPLRTGRYLTVWRKAPDGSWKVIWDGGAPDPRPGAPSSN